MKILLVDDHQLFREGVALLLQRLTNDLDLLQAASCEEAFALCDMHGDTDLILLDLNLAGMGGLDGLAVLRERYPGIPVVVVTSADTSTMVRKTIDAGAMGFIPKSSSSEIMLSALRLVLAKGIYLPPNVLLSEPSLAPIQMRSMSPVATASRAGDRPALPARPGAHTAAGRGAVSRAARQADQAHLPRVESRRRHRQETRVGRAARTQRHDADAGYRRRAPAGPGL